MLSPWIRRALIAGGFGLGQSVSDTQETAAVVGGSGGSSHHRHTTRGGEDDLERGGSGRRKSEDSSSADLKTDESGASGEYAPVLPEDTPFFHLDLEGAVKAAEATVARRA